MDGDIRNDKQANTSNHKYKKITAPTPNNQIVNPIYTNPLNLKPYHQGSTSGDDVTKNQEFK